MTPDFSTATLAIAINNRVNRQFKAWLELEGVTGKPVHYQAIWDDNLETEEELIEHFGL